MTTKIMKMNFANRNDLHLPRKLWHIIWGVGALCLYYFMGWEQKTAAFVCFFMAIGAFIFDFSRLKIPKVNKLVFKYMGAFMRKSEAHGMSGTPYYILGMAISLYFFSWEISLLSILFLVFSDPLSSLFGILLGKTKLLPTKSLEGSFTGFCVCYLLTFFFVYYLGMSQERIILFSALAGLIGSFSEFVSAFKIDDNLTIPVLSGLGLTFINHYFQLL